MPRPFPRSYPKIPNLILVLNVPQPLVLFPPQVEHRVNSKINKQESRWWQSNRHSEAYSPVWDRIHCTLWHTITNTWPINALACLSGANHRRSQFVSHSIYLTWPYPLRLMTNVTMVTVRDKWIRSTPASQLKLKQRVISYKCKRFDNTDSII